MPRVHRDMSGYEGLRAAYERSQTQRGHGSHETSDGVPGQAGHTTIGGGKTPEENAGVRYQDVIAVECGFSSI